MVEIGGTLLVISDSKKFLPSGLACLMVLAFLADQLVENVDVCLKKASAYW
jgi:hypothetical protein